MKGVEQAMVITVLQSPKVVNIDFTKYFWDLSLNVENIGEVHVAF